MRFNITLEELEKAVEYAKKHGESEFKTIAIHIDGKSGIGENVHVSDIYGSNKTDVTNYSAW